MRPSLPKVYRGRDDQHMFGRTEALITGCLRTASHFDLRYRPQNFVRVEALICKRATKSVVVTLPIWVGGEAQLTMLRE